MNQRNKPSELEAKLSANAIDAVAQVFDLGMSIKEFEQFKQQTIVDDQATVNEWSLESCPPRDTEEGA